MEKRSVLKKLIVILMLALLLPALLPAESGELICNPGECTACGAGAADCTMWWVALSFENFMCWMMACYAGVSFYACCSV